MRSGLTGVWANIRAHCSSPWLRTGLQNAIGSGGGAAGGAWPTMRVHAWVDSSSCLRHMSKNCVVGSVIADVLSGPRGQPARDLRPAVHGRAPPGDQRDVPARQLHVVFLAAVDG